MEIKGVLSTAMQSAKVEGCCAETESDSEWTDTLNATMEGEEDVAATAAEAETTAPAVEVLEVRYLDGATNTTKTGYVINGMAYEDQAGTIPVSDYSRFRTADGVLQVKTPYGVIRSADFALLLQQQGRYDTETFGEAIINADGDIVGTVNFTNGGMSVTAPRDSYTSAPGGPGTISQEIFDEYYTSVAGTVPVETVSGVLAEEGAAEAASETSSVTADSVDVARTAAYETGGTTDYGFDSSAIETAFTKLMLSAAGNALADSIMNDIASITKTMNASRYHDIFDTLAQ
jgi:hypothetical protein